MLLLTKVKVKSNTANSQDPCAFISVTSRFLFKGLISRVHRELRSAGCHTETKQISQSRDGKAHTSSCRE